MDDFKMHRRDLRQKISACGSLIKRKKMYGVDFQNGLVVMRK